MNSKVLQTLKESGVEVASACWDSDPEWFMPDEQGCLDFEVDGANICKLHSFSSRPELASPRIYELMKEFQPNVVLSMGGYEDTRFIAAIKGLYPNLFKWVAYLTIDSGPIPSQNKEAFDWMDSVLVSSKTGLKYVKELYEDAELLEYGPDESVFYMENRISIPKEIRVLCCSKNSQTTNIPAFIEAVSMANNSSCGAITGRLHTNIFDPGSYDIQSLIERFDKHECISLPTEYVGINDGISDEEMRQMYHNYDVIVDVSVRSSTGISVLEAMSCGCIPVLNNVCALSDILENCPESITYPIRGVKYLGEHGEGYQIADHLSLRRALMAILENHKQEDGWLETVAKVASETAKKYSCEKFLQLIKEKTLSSVKLEDRVMIDSF